MPVTQVGVSNFKSFADAQLNLSKITLLTGANSSGKSSLLAALLTPLQTHSFPYALSPNGEYVNLGDYREMVFGHDKSLSIGLALDVTDEHRGEVHLEVRYNSDPQSGLPVPSEIQYESRAFQAHILANGKYAVNYEYHREKDWLEDSDDDQILEFRQAMQSLLTSLESSIMEVEDKQSGSREQNSLETSEDELPEEDRQPNFDLIRRWRAGVTSGEFDTRPHGFPDRTDQQLPFDLQRQFRDIVSIFRELDNRFNYIGSFRLAPQRTYYRASKAALKVGRYGENYIDQILEWEDRKASELKKLRRYLRDLGLIARIRTNRLRGGRFDLIVSPPNSRVSSSIMDVGFGISQFLPIMVADLQLGSNSTLAVSQPELHLHPSVQAETANYFAARCREDGKQYILETHSEYLINRFRLLIAQGKMKPEDISVLYLRNSGGGSELFPISLGTDGSISGAPNDFFDTYMMDVLNIALNADS